MNARPTRWIIDNAAWSGAQPSLSVLIPFKGDDPVRLLAALDREPVPAEIVLLDDGSADAGLAARVAAQVEAMALPVRFVRLETNQGRAKGRNTLAEQARADYLLFLDSDMLPDTPDFLARWLQIAASHAPVAFGGFSLRQAALERATALHRAMAVNSDCVDAVARAAQPEKYVFTSNLLVRRDVFSAIAFDERFSGWGWEDIEWAMRVVKAWPILHTDNTATHLGLDTAAGMAAKFEQSVANFGRVVEMHPQIIAAYPSYKVARALKRLPLRGVWRPVVRQAALADALPLKLRAFAMRLYRAALYSEVV